MRPAKSMLSSIALIILAISPPAAAEQVILPASSYTATNNTGGLPISVDVLGWVHGLDYRDEWLEYHFDLLEFGVHSSSITVMGTTGTDFHLQMEITGDISGSVQVIHFNFTGSGFVGWGCEHIVAGSDNTGLYEPGYKVRLTTTTTADLQLLSISLPTHLGTGNSSWGNIKKIYR